MMIAEDLSKALASKFLEAGNYEAMGTPFGSGMGGCTAAAACSGFDDYFAQEEGFAGLAVQSVGYTKGADSEEVIIYVTKGSKRALSSVPKNVEGISIAAHVMGRLKAGPTPAMSTTSNSQLYEKNGRIACGSSCAPSREQYAGTLGAFITLGGKIHALSNNHVFSACNHTPVGMPILAPATMDARPNRRAPSQFCIFDNMIELRSGIPSLVKPMLIDAATAEVNDPTIISSWQGDDTGFDTPNTVIPPRSGMRVKKFGRTTGYTEGIIEAFIPTPWVLPYKSKRFSAEVWFTDTWTIRTTDGSPFALPGDSGSLVVTDEDGGASVGLIFAVNSQGGYAIMADLTTVISELGNPSLLHNHGV